MGNFASNAWNDMNEYYYKNSNNSIKTSDCFEERAEPTPLKSVTIGSDPRSPSIQFDRTPIQVIDSKQKKAIDSEEAEKMIEMSTALDPRSPTLGIDRTPIDFTNNHSIDVRMSALHLSFNSNASDLEDISYNSLIPEDVSNVCLSSTPINKEVDKTEDKSGQRVRTPLSCVQQKQTPNRNVIKQRKQLEITKRAHLNSHLMKTKSIADHNNDNSLNGLTIDEKENF